MALTRESDIQVEWPRTKGCLLNTINLKDTADEIISEQYNIFYQLSSWTSKKAEITRCEIWTLKGIWNDCNTAFTKILLNRSNDTWASIIMMHYQVQFRASSGGLLNMRCSKKFLNWNIILTIHDTIWKHSKLIIYTSKENNNYHLSRRFVLTEYSRSIYGFWYMYQNDAFKYHHLSLGNVSNCL